MFLLLFLLYIKIIAVFSVIYVYSGWVKYRKHDVLHWFIKETEYGPAI